jgi:tetratricopeptide (TPR) repeat protein
VCRLAAALNNQWNYKEAEAMYRRALTDYKKLGVNHPAIPGIACNLGHMFEFQEKYKDAERLYQQAYEGYYDLRGAEHPDTLLALCALG